MYKTASICKRGGTLMKSSLIRINLILILLFLFIPNFISAESKTFIKEYTYQASEYDSKVSCRTLALEQVKRLLLEELGTYLESETEVNNFKLTKDQITALTAGIVQTKILKEKWDGERYWIQAKIEADPSKVAKDVDALRKDREKSNELEDVRKKADELSRELERLRSALELSNKDQTNIAKYDKAIKELSATDWYRKGFSLAKEGNYDESISSLTKAIQLDPKYKEAYVSRAFAYSMVGNLQQAIADCNTAIEENPRYAHAYANRALAYYQLGNWQKSFEDSNKAIDANPEDSMAYESRCVVYFHYKKYQQAISDCSKAIELDPKNMLAYDNRAASYGMLGKYQELIEDENKVIDLNPKNSNALANRGSAYHFLGNEIQAIKDWKAAAKLGSKSAQNLLIKKGVDW
jgi:tetratricopeptide (TPR) repeat protein